MTSNGHHASQNGQSHAKRICGAKTRHGGICQNPPIIGRDRCRMHGGKHKRGLAHHSIATGRYSKDIPTRLAARYQEAVSDPELLNLTSEIGLVDTRLAELLDRLNTGKSRDFWGALVATVADLQGAFNRCNQQALSEGLHYLDELLIEVGTDYQAWAEIVQLTEQRRKLVETERKRRVDMHNMITADKAMLLIVRIGSIIREHVTDTGTLDKLTRAFDQLINQDTAIGVE